MVRPKMTTAPSDLNDVWSMCELLLLYPDRFFMDKQQDANSKVRFSISPKTYSGMSAVAIDTIATC